MPDHRLNDSITLSIERLNLLTNFSQEMFTRMNIQEVYEVILNSSINVVKDIQASLLLIVDSENHKLNIVGTRGIGNDAMLCSTINIGEGIAGMVAQKGIKQILTGDQFDLISPQVVSEKNIQTLISLPIKLMGNVIGVINLYLTASNQLSRIDEILLEILAGQSAVAIQNANLYQNIRHLHEDIGSVTQIAKGMTSTFDLNIVLNNILNASQQIANTSITSLWYKDFLTNKWKRKCPVNLIKTNIKLPNIQKGEGIIGYVLKTGKTYLCPDTTKDEHYFNTWQGTKSELAIPLIIEHEVRGILNVESNRFNAFSERHLQMLSILADEAAVSLRNARLYEIAEQKTRQFIMLKEINEALSYQKSLTEILTIIAQESQTIVGLGKKVAFVMLIDKQKNMLETKAAYGELFRPSNLKFHVPLEQQSIVTWVARNRKSRLAMDVTKDSQYLKITPETKSELCVPLFFRDEVIGVIDIESSELNAFGEKDVELLQTLANNTSIATKIGELCDIRLKQLEALYNTGTKISSSLNLDEVLTNIANAALNAIGSKNRTLLVGLLDENNDVIEIKVSAGTNGYRYIRNKINKDKGIAGWVLENHHHYLCSSVKNDPHYLEINPATMSELCVPIMFGDKIIGLINVESLIENDFGQYDIQLLQGLANQAGVAIENARLNERIANTQLQLTEALEVAVIGETLAGLAHDIRTCSSLISGEAQWIEHRHVQGKLSIEEALVAFKKIEGYVERVERLIEDLSKRSQQTPPIFKAVNMPNFVQDSIYVMQSRALHHHIQIIFDSAIKPFSAEIDDRRFKRVILNLLNNAIDAMPEGGIIKIKIEKDEEFFELHVSDTGIGITEKNLTKVWDKFFTTKKYGTGLGLPICKRIIENDHNGKITLDSQAGKGTTVTIKLPLKQSD